MLIDCPPALNMLTVNALVAAEGVLIPMQCEYYALEGLTALVSTIEQIKAGPNPGLEIGGILRTMFDPRNNLANEVSAQLIEHFQDKVFRTIIPRNVRLAEAPSYGKPALHYDRESRGRTGLPGPRRRDDPPRGRRLRSAADDRGCSRDISNDLAGRTGGSGLIREPAHVTRGRFGFGLSAPSVPLHYYRPLRLRTASRCPAAPRAAIMVTMATKRPSLGRGLGALLGQPVAVESSDVVTPLRSDEELQKLPVDLLQRGKYQPRIDMRQESLQELADSIKAQGVVQPIVVRPLNDDSPGAARRYEIIAGERRWRAAQIAGLHEIPALIRRVPDEAAIAMSLIENIQRENLNPLEEARALERLITEFEMTHATAAEAVGRSRAAVSNLLRLLELTDEVKALVEHRELEMGHARALLGLENRRQQAEVAALVAKKKLVGARDRSAGEATGDASGCGREGATSAYRSEHPQAGKRSEREAGCKGPRAALCLGQGQARHQLSHAG